MKNIVNFQMDLERLSTNELTKDILVEAKQIGFSDKQIAICVKSTELNVRSVRERCGMLLSRCVWICD